MPDETNRTVALLDALRRAADRGASTSVTVLASGVWMSGQVVRHEEYLRALAADFERTHRTDAGSPERAAVDGVQGAIAQQVAAGTDADEQLGPEVFLTQVKVAMPGGHLVATGPVAIRAPDVGAVVLGLLGAAPR
jgi:hypothetical protein